MSTRREDTLAVSPDANLPLYLLPPPHGAQSRRPATCKQARESVIVGPPAPVPASRPATPPTSPAAGDERSRHTLTMATPGTRARSRIDDSFERSMVRVRPG